MLVKQGLVPDQAAPGFGVQPFHEEGHLPAAEQLCAFCVGEVEEAESLDFLPVIEVVVEEAIGEPDG
jgi:hypothetical protein